MSSLSLHPPSTNIGNKDNGTVSRYSMQDFLSEDTKVEIVPAFDCPTLR